MDVIIAIGQFFVNFFLKEIRGKKNFAPGIFNFFTVNMNNSSEIHPLPSQPHVPRGSPIRQVTVHGAYRLL